MTPEDALSKAIEACGTAAELARYLGISGQALSQWKRVPPTRVLQVEEATGNRVTRHQLRPDLYPPPSSADFALSDSSDAHPSKPEAA